MKNKIILILLIIFFIIFGTFTSLYCIDQNRMRNNLPVIFSTWGKSYEPIIEIEENEPENNLPEENKEPEYKDENPVILGLYMEQGNNLVLIKEHTCDWSAENIMGLFYAIPSQEESILNSNFDTVWKNYINNYENPDNYRIGYSLDFNLNDGTQMHYQILNPDDAYKTFPKIMSFLYDDVNLIPGKPYYHITQDVMYDYTICSSLKLVGDIETSNISSDIKLTAFCWDSDDDFDPNTGLYRGKCFYQITIKK